jgi:hypothetical protein
MALFILQWAAARVRAATGRSSWRRWVWESSWPASRSQVAVRVLHCTFKRRRLSYFILLQRFQYLSWRHHCRSQQDDLYGSKICATENSKIRFNVYSSWRKKSFERSCWCSIMQVQQGNEHGSSLAIACLQTRGKHWTNTQRVRLKSKSNISYQDC